MCHCKYFSEVPGYFFFFGAYELGRKLLARPTQTKEEIGLFVCDHSIKNYAHFALDLGMFKTAVAGAAGKLESTQQHMLE